MAPCAARGRRQGRAGRPGLLRRRAARLAALGVAVCLAAGAARGALEAEDQVQFADGLYARGMYKLAAKEYTRYLEAHPTASILHGIEAPNIVHTNTLAENLADIQDKDRFDVILANPPFGGKERKEVQQNFPIRTGETAFLFLQHFIKRLKAGGRGGVVIKNTFLSNTDNASVSLRKLLLESCNLHTVLDCPGGTFQGAGVKTVVLFFEKGAPTRKVWYYQLDPGRNLGKTNPLNDADLAEFVEAAEDLRRFAQELERGRGGHRPGDLRSVGEEPERWRGSQRTAARRRSWTRSPRWMRRVRKCWRISGRCYEDRVADQDARRDCELVARRFVQPAQGGSCR